MIDQELTSALDRAHAELAACYKLAGGVVDHDDFHLATRAKTAVRDMARRLDESQSQVRQLRARVEQLRKSRAALIDAANELIAADREYDDASHRASMLGSGGGAPDDHPALLDLRLATERRATALSPFRSDEG